MDMVLSYDVFSSAIIPASALPEKHNDAIGAIGGGLNCSHHCGLVLTWSNSPIIIKTRRSSAGYFVECFDQRLATTLLSLTPPNPDGQDAFVSSVPFLVVSKVPFGQP